MRNVRLREWFGMTQGGIVIHLGEHTSIDGADETEEGRNCIWIWDEESLRETQRNIAEVLV